METGFASLRAAFDKLRQEFKHKIEEMKRKVTQFVERKHEFYTKLGGHSQGEVEGKHEGNEGWSGKSQHERSTAGKEIGIRNRRKHQARIVHPTRKPTFQQYPAQSLKARIEKL